MGIFPYFQIYPHPIPPFFFNSIAEGEVSLFQNKAIQTSSATLTLLQQLKN